MWYWLRKFNYLPRRRKESGVTENKGMKKMLGGGMIMPDQEFTFDCFEQHLDRYAFAAEFVTGKIVLDVACGPGYGSHYLFSEGAAMVVGGDIYIKAIEAARKFYSKPGVEFLVLDATRLPFTDNSFNVIVSMETIEHLEQYKDYLSECKRVLKEGGIFICSTPYKGRDIPDVIKGLAPYHAHEFSSLEEFQGQVSQFFTETKVYGQGCWDKLEKRKWIIWVKMEKVITPFIPYIPKLLYESMRFFYRRFKGFIVHERYIKLSEITDFDVLLTEKYKLFPIDSNSPIIPKTIIAVARK